MRSVSQIYSEAVKVRNNYLQLTELNAGRSNSKLSMLNLLTYVAAVCIHTYEAVLDLFQVRLAELLNGRMNGTPDWYVMMARKFQYNDVTETGDELHFNEDTMKVEYDSVDTSHRIVDRAAWQLDNGSLTLKVCRANDDQDGINNGTPYKPLSEYELTAFRMYIQQIKFVGADIYCESCPGDILSIYAGKDAPVYYDDRYVTAVQALANIRRAIIDLANEMEFNSYLYYQTVLDTIRKADHISDVGDIRVYVSQYNTLTRGYNDPIPLTGRMRLKSGFIRLLDENSVNAVNASSVALAPLSQMNTVE